MTHLMTKVSGILSCVVVILLVMSAGLPTSFAQPGSLSSGSPNRALSGPSNGGGPQSAPPDVAPLPPSPPSRSPAPGETPRRRSPAEQTNKSGVEPSDTKTLSQERSPVDKVDRALSTIEQAFKDLTAPTQPSGSQVPPLRQFGYQFFQAPVSTFAPVDDVPVGPDYVLGPGDDLSISIWGNVDSTIVRTVDRSGQIVLPKVGGVRVWGLTFSQADLVIRERLGHYFRGFQTSLTLGRLRTIRVHIVGDVRQPGSYTISSLSTLTSALMAAGGPAPTGSLREIRLFRNNHVVGDFDFYDYLLRGDKRKDFRVESGDTIFIPSIGPVVGIVGEVKRPAIYELRAPTRLADLVAMSGGFTPRSYLKRVQIIRARKSAERVAVDLNLTNFYVKGDPAVNVLLEDGDLIRVFPSDPRLYNIVTLAGSAKYPGEYQLQDGMRITELLPQENLLPEALLDRIEVARNGPDFSTQIIAINLRQAWNGDLSQDVVLKPQDQVTVLTQRRTGTGSAFRTVTLSGEFKRPGSYVIAQGERLSSVIRRAAGFTERAYLKGAGFTRVSLKEIEQEKLTAFVRTQEERLLAAAGTTVVGVEKEEAAHSAQVIAARRELLQALASRVALGRLVVRLDEPDRLEGTFDDILLEDGDSLKVGQRPGSILVLGAVRTSTSVTFQEGANADYYINRVGGFTKAADQREVHILKADGSAASGFSKIRSVEPGDAVIVPPKEEEKIRTLPTLRDVVTIIGSTLLSIAALAIIF